MDSSVALFGEICALTTPSPATQNELYSTLSHYTIISNYTAATWSETVSQFLYCKRNEGCSPATISSYSSQLNNFGKYLSEVMPAAITTDDLYFYISHLKDSNLKKTTINQYVSILRIFFEWCKTKNYIENNPVLDVKPLPKDNPYNRALTEEEVSLIRSSYKNVRERAICEFFLTTGCRVTEITDIKLSDINFDELSVKITGKGDKIRTVYFNAQTLRYLQDYFEVRPRGEYLFYSERRPYKPTTKAALEAMIHKLGIRAGLSSNLFPHRFRHYFATHLFKLGMKIEIIQHLMGHTTPQTTLKYITMEETEIKNIYNSIYD